MPLPLLPILLTKKNCSNKRQNLKVSTVDLICYKYFLMAVIVLLEVF